MPTSISILSAWLGLVALAHAHTWIEQMTVIDSSGTFTGDPGFARGNVLRSSPGFSDPLMVNLIPPNGGVINDITSDMPMCMPSQQQQVQTSGSPRLQAAPGSAIALRYQENGHVTLPDNQPGKPANRGTVFVYGTTQPSANDSLLGIHRVWNAQGTGGDERGVLLSTQNFDDGQCYQINGGSISLQRQAEFPHTADATMGADIWCQQDVALPANAPSGQPYTLYWVWDWPTLPGTAGFPDGKQEIYTTCMDVDVVGSSSASAVVDASSFDVGQSLNSAAISSEMAQITNPTAVNNAETIPFSGATAGATQGSDNTVSAPQAATTATTFAATSSGFQQPAQTFTTSSVAVGAPQDSQQPQQPTQPSQSIATDQPQATQTDDGQGGHSHTRGGGAGGQQASEAGFTQAAATTASAFIPVASASSPDFGGMSSSVQPVDLSSSNAFSTSAPVVTDGPEAGAAQVTVTEMDSVTMTVFQTVINTTFEKRKIKIIQTQEPVAAVTSSTKPACPPRPAAKLARRHSHGHGLRRRNSPFALP